MLNFGIVSLTLYGVFLIPIKKATTELLFVRRIVGSILLQISLRGFVGEEPPTNRCFATNLRGKILPSLISMRACPSARAQSSILFICFSDSPRSRHFSLPPVPSLRPPRRGDQQTKASCEDWAETSPSGKSHPYEGRCQRPKTRADTSRSDRSTPRTSRN